MSKKKFSPLEFASTPKHKLQWERGHGIRQPPKFKYNMAHTITKIKCRSILEHIISRRIEVLEKSKELLLQQDNIVTQLDGILALQGEQEHQAACNQFLGQCMKIDTEIAQYENEAFELQTSKQRI